MEDVIIKTMDVSERLRKDFGDIEDLASSISRLGLLQPIVLDDHNNLIAGGRRLAACMHLGMESIAAVRKRDLSEADKKEIELEENIKRKDLTWQEEVTGLLQLYEIKQNRYGKRTGSKFGEQGFGIENAAKELDRSIGSISMDLQLARGLTEFAVLLQEKT